MKAAAKKREFETAAELRRRLFALRHINDVSLLKTDYRLIRANKRIEAYDVAHISETNRVGVMTVVEDGEANKKEYRTFNIKCAGAGDTAALSEILTRRLRHSEWPLPRLIVVDGGIAQKNTALKVLKEFGYQIPVVAVVKNERHRPERILGSREDLSGNERAIVLANAEAHRFSLAKHRIKRSRFS
jgi:excinuclease ABC subunit C